MRSAQRSAEACKNAACRKVDVPSLPVYVLKAMLFPRTSSFLETVLLEGTFLSLYFNGMLAHETPEQGKRARCAALRLHSFHHS
eukprot:1149987-Pelagomonas_calceolata.AAC.1